jgi:hypothetical protein
MKTMKPSTRRNFLLAAGMGSAAAAAAVVTAGKAPPAKARADLAAAEPSGYRSTEHIQKYYKTTKV